MWASPSKIPISISFTSSGNFIEALSASDKRVIPFVELATNNTGLPVKNKEDKPIEGMLKSKYFYFVRTISSIKT